MKKLHKLREKIVFAKAIREKRMKELAEVEAFREASENQQWANVLDHVLLMIDQIEKEN